MRERLARYTRQQQKSRSVAQILYHVENYLFIYVTIIFDMFPFVFMRLYVASAHPAAEAAATVACKQALSTGFIEIQPWHSRLCPLTNRHFVGPFLDYLDIILYIHIPLM